MGATSSIMRPQEIMEFRKLNTVVAEIDLPARPESRKLTDKKGYFLLGLTLLITIPLVIYSLANADIRRFTNEAYDNCGNLCGEINERIDGVDCSGKDYLDLEYSLDFKCVYRCPSGYESDLGVCEPKETDSIEFSYVYNNDQELGPGLSTADWWKFVVSILITIVLSLFTLCALRYAPGPVVWGIIVLCVLVKTGLVVFVWYLYGVSNDEKNRILALAVGITIFAAIWLTILIALFKRIGLVVQLYKEAIKVFASLPLLIFVPIVTTFVQIIIGVVVIMITAFLFTSRELQKVDFLGYEYEMNTAMVLAIFFNFFVIWWIYRIIIGIQYMIISGSVVSWYFAKNKQYLDSPIFRSMKITFRYHIGTIVFGSLLINLFSIVKSLIRACCRNSCCRCLVIMCCERLDVFLNFLSENSYIVTAIHGQSFLRSAKRAVKLLITNAKSLIAVTCVGSFVLVILILVISLVSTLVSYALFMNLKGSEIFLALGICLVVNIFIVSTIFTVFEIIIDALFICFCEDTTINDGMARPFCMSKGLMEFVENSKKLFGDNN